MLNKVDIREYKQLERELKEAKATALPYAMRFTLNAAAIRAQQVSRLKVATTMVNRNKWTINSIKHEKARGNNPRNMMSKVGSLQPYMETQELGGVKRAKGKQGTPIPTGFSAGQEGARPRTKLPRPTNKLKNIQIRRNWRRRKKGTKKSRAIGDIKTAAAAGNKFVYLDFGKPKSKGIYRLTGGRRKTKIKMVHSLGRKSVRIPRNPWLRPSVVRVSKDMPGMYIKALKFQLNRLHLFK